MCRHLAWIGAPRTLAALTTAPPYGLLRQSWAPRRMRHGTVNADGFGVGWYAPRARREPARYRRAVPMWTDASFASFAPVVTSGCVLAAVRSATVGMPVEETATAPFVAGRLLLSHNGRVDPRAVRRALADVPGAPEPDSRCDAAGVAALVWEGAARMPLTKAVAETVLVLGSAVEADGTPARLNLLVTDGAQIVGTTWGDTLSYRIEPDGVMVASEPHDDEAGWIDVPDQQLLVADTHKVTLSNLIP